MRRDDDTTTETDHPSEPGYVVAPAILGHRSYRRWSVIAIGATVVVALAVAKPWDPPAGTPSEAAVAMSPTATLGGPTPSRSEPPGPSASETPETWPVMAAATPIRQSVAEDPSARTILVSHAGSWGVATVGDGPRFVRDEPWVDWAAVVPEPSTRAADRIATWPGTGICTGIPVLLDRPTAIGVSTSIDLGADPPIEAWWSDGGRTAALEGSIRELYALGDGGLTVLERLDGSAWPAGRYEFHVGRGDRIVALVVCVARSG